MAGKIFWKSLRHAIRPRSPAFLPYARSVIITGPTEDSAGHFLRSTHAGVKIGKACPIKGVANKILPRGQRGSHSEQWIINALPESASGAIKRPVCAHARSKSRGPDQ